MFITGICGKTKYGSDLNKNVKQERYFKYINFELNYLKLV